MEGWKDEEEKEEEGEGEGEEGRGANSQSPGVAQSTVVRPPAGVPPFPGGHTLRERVTCRGPVLFRDGRCNW